MGGTADGDADAYRPDAAPLPTKAASRARPRHRGRAPRAGGRVRDGRVGGACARQRIGVARTAALDRRHAPRGGSRCGLGDSVFPPRATAARDAPRDQHPRNLRSRFVRPLARRPADRLRGIRRWGLAPLAAVPGVHHRAAAGGHRGRGLSLLVARQPRGRLLRRCHPERRPWP